MGVNALEHRQAFDADSIGARLKAHRVQRRLSPDGLASRLGISRAALYRAEAGDITKIETLVAIAKELDTSVASLLGSGSEYTVDATYFFERMRQVEHDADQIIGLFSPVSFLLTSSDYEEMLKGVLSTYDDHREKTEPGERADIEQLLHLLRLRKERYELRKPVIASIISAVDLERFLRNGLETRYDLSESLLHQRRIMATREVKRIVQMLRDQPIGVQIVLASEPIPAINFQIARQGTQSTLTISPFRLGQDPNVQVGVGQITSAPDALHLHEQVAKRLWEGSLKGVDAADKLDSLIKRFGLY